MDFGLNEQQEMMKTMARDFLSAEYPEKLLRETAGGEEGNHAELWRKMAAMNWMGLSLPEEYGGMGDFLDLAVVLEEMGRHCLISPFFTSVVLGAGIIIEAGNEDQKRRYLPDIAEGKTIVTLALNEASVRYTPDAVTVRTVPQSDGFAISGTKLFVPDALASDYLVCVTRSGEEKGPSDGITLFLMDSQAPGISCHPMKTISGDRLYEVVFENVAVSSECVLGEIGGGWPYVAKIIARAAVARCAEMVGMAAKMLEITLDYAKERSAFGHPIGAFQAVQHRCADMAVDSEGSRFLTYRAACLINEGLPASREVAMAKAWVNQACRRVAASAHQLHGAIGFTEDHILHFYTKKAKTAEFSFGDADFHLEKLAASGRG